MLLRQTYRSQLRSPDRKYRPKADIRIDTSGLGALIVVRFPGRRQRNGPSVYETQGGTWRRPPCLVQMFRALSCRLLSVASRRTSPPRWSV